MDPMMIEMYDADVQRVFRNRILQGQATRLLQIVRHARRNERRVQVLEQRSASVILRLEDRLAAQVV
jgi:hypothetical protein